MVILIVCCFHRGSTFSTAFIVRQLSALSNQDKIKTKAAVSVNVIYTHIETKHNFYKLSDAHTCALDLYYN